MSHLDARKPNRSTKIRFIEVDNLFIMPTKEELIERIDNSEIKHYTKPIVKDFIHSVSLKGIGKPKYLKKGDVFIHGFPKFRPNVVISVGSECSYYMSLSTTKDCMNIYESKSRFFEDGYFSKGIMCAPNSVIMERLAGVYDNHKRLNKAIEEARNHINKMLG